MLGRSQFTSLWMTLLLACSGNTVAPDAGESPMDAGSESGDAAVHEDAATPTDAGTTEDAGERPGDAGTEPTDAGSECSQCIGEALRWELDGGFRPYHSINEVEPCRRYEHSRMPLGGGGTTTSCSNLVPCQGDAITIADLNAALAHPDVVAAFAAAPILYGRDARPVDGTLFQITQSSRTVSVGFPCSGSDTDCVDIPPGVEALRMLLTSLEGERLAEEDCASTFP